MYGGDVLGIRAIAIGWTVLIAAAGLLLAATAAPRVSAVEPGVNCDPYAGGVCVIELGDIWFCSEGFAGEVCPSSIRAGETVRWEYPASGMSVHTTTHCGQDCDAPTDSPLWDSSTLNPGDDFEFTFAEPGMYNYYCVVHPLQRGIIRVLEEGDVLGDVDCGGTVNAIDAALVLQHTAALLDELPCPQNGDTSDDGLTNSLDAALILQVSAGLIDGF
jgi:hypothetical protein